MEFSNVIVNPKDGIPMIASPVLSKNTELQLETTSISFRISLRPIELIAMVRLFGRSCISVSRSRRTEGSHVFNGLVREMAPDKYKEQITPDRVEGYRIAMFEACKDETLISQTEFDCRVYLSGKNILNACSGVLANFYMKDDESEYKLLDNDSIMTKVILPKIYHEVYDMAHTEGHVLKTEMPGVGKYWKPHKVTDNPFTNIGIDDNSVRVMVVTGVNGYVNLASDDFIEQFNDYKNAMLADTDEAICKESSVGAEWMLLIARMPLLSFIEMSVLAPASWTILDNDDITAIPLWNHALLSDFDYGSIERSSLMPANAQISAVIKINLRDLDNSIRTVKQIDFWYDKYFRNTIEQARELFKL